MPPDRIVPRGLLYFLAPLLALDLFFLPLGGAEVFGLKQGGWKFTLYLLLINLPYGIVTALVATSGRSRKHPREIRNVPVSPPATNAADPRVTL
jgi:hypothetical protein